MVKRKGRREGANTLLLKQVKHVEQLHIKLEEAVKRKDSPQTIHDILDRLTEEKRIMSELFWDFYDGVDKNVINKVISVMTS